jgi:glycine/D-amino acid oxidase-like deaminating enzyme
MGPYVEKAMSRVPMLFETGVKKFFCGPESFTPDLLPIIGEAPELKNTSWRRGSTRSGS